MAFLKKFALAFGAIALILGGGAGTQSNSMLMQGSGFIGLLIGLVVLYIFIKMAWRAMGCLPSFLAVGGIIAFVLYAIGGFSNGIMNVGNTVKSFIGQSQQQNPQTVGISEEFAPMGEESQPQQKQQSVAMPTIEAPAQVISGDTLAIEGRYFYLFGIDAPEINQTCADARGRSYNCGLAAQNWLSGWISDNILSCNIMQQDSQGNLVGACSLGEYDLGAALVNAGWAVANRSQADIYVPYENQARQNRQGLWKGQFYMPKDWRALQAKKPKIKIIESNPKKKKGWFS